TGAAIIAQRFLEQLFVFAAELWMRISKCFDRFVNVLAIIDTDRPVLKRFHGVLRGATHGGIRVRLLDESGPIRRETSLVSGVVQRGNSALESHLGLVLGTDLIQ